MIQIKLDALFRRQADENKRTTLGRLLAAIDVKGKALALKKRLDGRRLGGASVPAGIARGSVRTRPDGWSTLFGWQVGLFCRGDGEGGNQPPRMVVGISRAERAKFQRQAEDEIAKQITEQLARGAR